MNNDIKYLTWKTLINGQKVEAEVRCPSTFHLAVKFQVWAQAMGCTYEESHAMYFADDRGYLAEHYNLKKAKQYIERGFSKIEGKKIPTLTHFHTPIKVNFSEPDKYGEIHGRLQVDLDMKKKVKYVTLQIDGGEPAIYRLDYDDVGTVGYARMQGGWAIGGRLTNISMDWTKPHPNDFGIINVMGTVQHGLATLTIWQTAPQVIERTLYSIKDTVADGKMEVAVFMLDFREKKARQAKKPALKQGEPIVTAATLEASTTGIICHPDYLKNRRPSRDGKIWGFLPGHGGDVWVVKHDHGDAVYFIEEMLTPES